MASKFVCECGRIIRTNLYEGNDVNSNIKVTHFGAQTAT